MKEQVIQLMGKKSYGLIAREFGLTRNQVAGIIFRHKNNGAKRVNRPKTGHGAYAAEYIQPDLRGSAR